MPIRIPMGPFREVFYLQPGETVRSTCADHGLELMPLALQHLDDRSDMLLSRRPCARQVLAPWPPLERRRFYPHVLFWTDPRVPRMLDEGPERRQDADNQLSTAINAGASRRRCRACGSEFRTVQYEGTEPLLIGVDTSRRDIPFINRCPSCDADLGTGVVDILFGLD